MLHAACDGLTQKQLFDSRPGGAGRFAGQRAAEQQHRHNGCEKDGYRVSRRNQESCIRVGDDRWARITRERFI